VQAEIDTPAIQRASVAGGDLGIAMQGDSGSVTLTVTATSESVLTTLGNLVPVGRSVMDSWDFTVDGILPGSDTMLSCRVGEHFSIEDLNIWHFDGTDWVEFNPSYISLSDDGYLSFAVSGFSSYAVTGLIPEPGSLGLLLLCAGFGWRRRR